MLHLAGIEVGGQETSLEKSEAFVKGLDYPGRVGLSLTGDINSVGAKGEEFA